MATPEIHVVTKIHDMITGDRQVTEGYIASAFVIS